MAIVLLPLFAEMLAFGMKEVQVCLVKLSAILMEWSALSKIFCSSLLNKGLILNHCQQLLDWTRKDHSKVMKHVASKLYSRTSFNEPNPQVP